MGHRTDAMTIIRAVDVLALTSRSEGSPNAVLEAVQVDTPVVSVDVGDVATLIQGTAGQVIAGRDPQDLAQAMLKVLAASRTRPSTGPRTGLDPDEIMNNLVAMLAPTPGRAVQPAAEVV